MDVNGDAPGVDIILETKGRHKLLGLDLQQDDGAHPVLINCIPGTTSSKVPKWRSTIRNARLKTINNLPVHTILDAEKAIKAARVANEKTITAHFTTPDRVSMHPQQGIPQLHMDTYVSNSNVPSYGKNRRRILSKCP